MPAFAYTVLDSHGRSRTGTCDSADLQSAVAELRAEELYVVEIRPGSGAFANRPAALGRVARGVADRVGLGLVSQRDRIQFFRETCLMLRAGLPLLHALEVFRDHCAQRAFAAAVGRIGDRVRSGSSFSAAMAGEKRLFRPLIVRMVATGEATGELDTMLERVADHLEHRAELRSTLVNGLTYPALVVLITGGVIAFLITQVIPKFMRVLAGRNLALPPSTQLLVDVSAFLREHGLTMILACVSLLLVLMVAYTTRSGRYVLDRLLLSVPLVGLLLRLSLMAHFGRTLAILLRSGVSLLDGLHLLAEGVPNAVFRAHLRGVEQAVLEGRTLSSSLRARFVSPLLLELISVGEVTGNLDTVLEAAGEHFEGRLKRTIRWMASLFEPAMILIVGGIVGFVYISFFQVLYQLSAR